MQILQNGLVQIKNYQTGETRTVKPDDLPMYGANVLNQYINMVGQNQPTGPSDQSNNTQTPNQPQQDLPTTIGNALGNILFGASKPFRQAAQGVSDIGASGAYAVDKYLLKDPNADKKLLSMQPIFLNDQENQQALAHPVQTGIQSGLGMASYAVPFGKGANILSKLLLPGAAVGALQGASQDNATPASVAGNAALGAGGAGVLGGLGPVLSKVLKGGGAGLDAAGNQIIKGQYAGPKSVADINQLGNTVAQLKQYGINSIKDMAKIAPQVTGDTGVITRITRDAVANAGPVRVTDIPQIAQDVVDNEPLISKSVGDKFVSQVSKIKGSTQANVAPRDPQEVFDFIKEFQSKAASLRHGSTDEARALGQAYQNVSNELTDRLYQESGADNALTKAISPEALAEIEKISPKLAQEVSQAKTVGQLRSIAAPFVKGSKLAQATENAKSNELPGDLAAFGGVGALEAVLSGGINPATLPFALGGYVAKKAITSDAGQAVLSKVLSGSGVGAKAAGESVSGVAENPIMKLLSGQAGARRGVALGQPGALPNQMANNGQTSNNQTNNTGSNGIKQDVSSPSSSSIAPAANGGNAITPKMVQNAYLSLSPQQADRVKAAYDAQFGGANNVLNPIETKNLNTQIDKLVSTYKKMNFLQKINPQDPTNQDLQAQRASIVLEIIRSSAGRVSKQELDQATGNFLTPFTTNPEAQGEALKNLVNNKAQGQ